MSLKHLSKTTIIIILMNFFLSCGNSDQTEKFEISNTKKIHELTYPNRVPDKTIVKGDWKIIFYYSKKGTVDEGMDGFLIYKNHNVAPPDNLNKKLKTKLGLLRFIPDPKDLNKPNTIRGWNFNDKSLYPWTNEQAKNKFEGKY